MKKTLRFIGIAALAAAIGFGFAGCDTGGGALVGGGGGGGDDTQQTPQYGVAEARALANFDTEGLPDSVRGAFGGITEALHDLADELAETQTAGDIEALVAALHRLMPNGPNGGTPLPLNAFAAQEVSLALGGLGVTLGYAPVAALVGAINGALSDQAVAEALLADGGLFVHLNALHAALTTRAAGHTPPRGVEEARALASFNRAGLPGGVPAALGGIADVLHDLAGVLRGGAPNPNHIGDLVVAIHYLMPGTADTPQPLDASAAQKVANALDALDVPNAQAPVAALADAINGVLGNMTDAMILINGGLFDHLNDLHAELHKRALQGGWILPGVAEAHALADFDMSELPEVVGDAFDGMRVALSNLAGVLGGSPSTNYIVALVDALHDLMPPDAPLNPGAAQNVSNALGGLGVTLGYAPVATLAGAINGVLDNQAVADALLAAGGLFDHLNDLHAMLHRRARMGGWIPQVNP